MGMVASSGAGLGIDQLCPGRGMARVAGKAGQRPTQSLVAGISEDDPSMFSGGIGDGGDSGFSGELFLRRETSWIVAELGQDLRRVDLSSSREGHHDLAGVELCDGVLDLSAELPNLSHKPLQHVHEGSDEISFGVFFQRPSEPPRGRSQSREEVFGWTAAGVSVASEKPGDAFGAEALGCRGCGVLVEECEGDRCVDGCEDLAGAGPEAFQQSPQLVGQRHALGDQIISGAHKGSQRADLIGERLQWPEAVPIGAQQVGQDEGIPRIALSGGCTVARPGSP